MGRHNLEGHPVRSARRPPARHGTLRFGATVSGPMSQTALTSPSVFTPALFRRSLGDALELAHGVDAVAAEERAASLAKRSLKKESKVWGLNLAISMIDLTTLEGKDTRGKVYALCQKAMRPDPLDHTVPHVAAVCVYPAMIGFVKQALTGSGVAIAP